MPTEKEPFAGSLKLQMVLSKGFTVLTLWLFRKVQMQETTRLRPRCVLFLYASQQLQSCRSRWAFINSQRKKSAVRMLLHIVFDRGMHSIGRQIGTVHFDRRQSVQRFRHRFIGDP